MADLQDITSPMTALEKRAIGSLSIVYAIRMFGLFLIMPVLSLYAADMEGAKPSLIGLAIGIYGISQALLQIPFGLLSDSFGRKKIIVIGLLLFCAGSIVAAVSTSIYGIIAGRILQGSGAIAAAVMALIADLTQEVHRTKAMALIGASIGVSFGIAIVAGPVIGEFIGLHGLFWFIAVLALLSILVILFAVPNPQKSKKHRDAEVIPSQFSEALANTNLLRLDYGIFILHVSLTASFVIVPLLMRDAGLIPAHHWMVYLPIFAASLAVMVPFVILAEKKRRMKSVFIGAISVLLVANLGFMLFNQTLTGVVGFLFLFFCGFNLLEATLPSLVSKTAPADLRGTAMGAYSTCQFMGAGIGGAAGGWCYGKYGADAVFLMCALFTLSWLLVSITMKTPRYLANLFISLEKIDQLKISALIDEMLTVAGVEEVTVHLEEAVAYLKVDNHKLDRNRLTTLITAYGDS